MKKYICTFGDAHESSGKVGHLAFEKTSAFVMALTLGKDAIGHYNSIIAVSDPYLAAPWRIFQQYKGILYR